jgi:predicted ester cyclase
MSPEDNKRAVAEFVERCQNDHDLAFADEAFHPDFVNHYRPEGLPIPGTDRPASGFQTFYGALLLGFPDATVEIDEQLAERDLVATRKTFRGTHLHIGARISALAGAGEVLVSSTVRDLVAGSGMRFEERGLHELKGVPDPWRVLALLDG